MKTKLKILHLEDIPADAELVERELKKGKIQFESLVVDSKSAFENALREFVPDIVLADHSLPSFNSLEAIGIMKQKGIKIPIILVTATVSDEYALEVMKAGADDYILKDRLHRLPHTIMNVMEKNSAEQQLKESETFNKGVLSSLSSHITVIDQNGTLITVNQAWNDFGNENGITSLDHISTGSNYFDVCKRAIEEGDSDAAQALAGIQSVLNNEKQQFEMEYPCHSPDEQRWFILSVKNFGTDSYKVVIAHHDISERKKSEEVLRKSESNLQAIFENTSEGFILADPDGIVKSFNTNATQTILLNTEQVIKIGSSIFDFIPSSRKESYSRVLSKVLEGETKHYDYLFERKNGDKKWFSFNINPAYNKSSQIEGFCITSNDITNRKILEKQLNELNVNLKKQANDLAISNKELEGFAYITSHDLQEPLRMVTGFLGLLEKKYGDVIDEKGKQYIHFAVDGAKRMRQIIVDLLEFSRIGKIENEENLIDLNDLVREVLILHKKQIKETKAIIIFENLPSMVIYKTPLFQVFQNLIGNSLKYHTKGVSPTVNISSEETETNWQFSVKDNGIGINEEYFNKIFMLFHRLHNKGQYLGTGIGLAVCKKIIENFGGKIWIESEQNMGSTFYFTIPKK